MSRKYEVALRDMLSAIDQINDYLSAHEYFRVNLEIIWDIIENELPGLQSEIAAILERKE